MLCANYHRQTARLRFSPHGKQTRLPVCAGRIAVAYARVGRNIQCRIKRIQFDNSVKTTCTRASQAVGCNFTNNKFLKELDMYYTKIKKLRLLLSIALAIGLVLCLRNQAQADGQWNLTISEDQDFARDILSPFEMHMAMRKTEADIEVGRANPTFVLTNNGTEDITEFSITLRGAKATQYAFDMVQVVEDTVPVDVLGSLTSPTDAIFGGATSDRLAMDFVNPLTPGGQIIFQVYLATLPGAPTFVADYRRVLLDMDLATTLFADTADNALVDVQFANNTFSQAPLFEYLPLSFDNYVNAAAGATGLSRFGNGGHHMVSAMAISLDPGDAVIIPEPTTCTLALLGVGMASCLRHGRRRKRANCRT